MRIVLGYKKKKGIAECPIDYLHYSPVFSEFSDIVYFYLQRMTILFLTNPVIQTIFVPCNLNGIKLYPYRKYRIFLGVILGSFAS